MTGKSKGLILIQRVMIWALYFFSGFILYSNQGILPSLIITFSRIVYPLSIFWLQIRIKKRTRGINKCGPKSFSCLKIYSKKEQPKKKYDLYVDIVRANEWDAAAGHAIAAHAGAIVTDMDGQSFEYGKEDYKNPTILIRRSKNLNV